MNYQHHRRTCVEFDLIKRLMKQDFKRQNQTDFRKLFINQKLDKNFIY